MVQQQSFKLHVHILIQLFFPRQAVQEMINTNNKKGQRKAVTISHNAAGEKTGIAFSQTWKKKTLNRFFLMPDLFNNLNSNTYFFQVLRDISTK